jgi:hypothetical protein
MTHKQEWATLTLTLTITSSKHEKDMESCFWETPYIRSLLK